MNRFAPPRPVLRIIDMCLILAVFATLALTGTNAWREKVQAIQEAELKSAFDLRDYIELKSIVIDNAVEGEPIYLHVIRDLHRDFDGFYRVTLRNANGGAVICSTGRIAIPYRVSDSNGDPTQLPEPLLLSFWADGGTCTDDLRRGLTPGAYALETCHGHQRPPGFDGPQEICWSPLPVFTVLPRETPP